MRSWFVIVGLGVLAACYAPSAAPGAPCGAGSRCPSGLVCIDDVCVEPGTLPADAAPGDGAPDAGDPPASCTNGQRDGDELGR